MQIQATYQKSEDSKKLLENLNGIAELQRGNVRILFNNRSPEDQKLLQHLSTSFGNRKWWHLDPETVKTIGLATVFSISFMVYGLAGLWGFM